MQCTQQNARNIGMCQDLSDAWNKCKLNFGTLRCVFWSQNLFTLFFFVFFCQACLGNKSKSTFYYCLLNSSFGATFPIKSKPSTANSSTRCDPTSKHRKYSQRTSLIESKTSTERTSLGKHHSENISLRKYITQAPVTGSTR